MKTQSVKLAGLSLLEKNPRRHPNLQIQELKRSLEMFGQIRPLVIDDKGNVLAGNGMLIAMREMGWETADALRVEGLNEKQKTRLILADNKVASLGADDYHVIEELIRDLSDELNIPGFDDNVLRTLVATPAQLAEISAGYGSVSLDTTERAVAKTAALAGASERAEARQADGSAPAPAGTPARVCESCGQTVWQ
jgi:ParB-like chromosome segregation protein Spo0J